MTGIAGIVIFIIGIAIRYGVNRRRYNRRFRPIQKQSFENHWLKHFRDEFLVFISIFCLIVGAVLMLLGYNEHRKNVYWQEHQIHQVEKR